MAADDAGLEVTHDAGFDGGLDPGDAGAEDAGSSDARMIEVTAGAFHTCLFGPGVRPSCGGANEHGQLGLGTKSAREPLTPVSQLMKAKQLAAGGSNASSAHTCAIAEDSTLWCWGKNDVGQLGNGSHDDSATPVQVSSLQRVEEISLGAAHGCARAGGEVWCWGRGDSGQLGVGSLDDHPRPTKVPGLSDVVQVTAGYFHTCALRATGAALCWGPNGYGELGNDQSTASLSPSEVSGEQGWAQLSAGGFTTCGRRTNGAVWCWGSAEYGQLGNGQRGAGEKSRVPVEVSGVGPSRQIAAGGVHACALEVGGAVRCWGSNVLGQLGDGTTTTRERPVTVPGLTDAAWIELGAQTSFARRAGGQVVAWGGNSHGQLVAQVEATRATSPQVVPLPGG